VLVLLLRTIVEKDTVGDMVEVGVYKGYTAKLIHYYMPERKLHLFDTFEGFTDRGVIAEKQNTNLSISGCHFADTSIEAAKSYISQKNGNVLYYKGCFPESIPDDFEQLVFSFVHLDADLYDPTLQGLEYFYPRMSRNGLIVVHDYNAWPGARKAVDGFFLDKCEMPVPMPDKSGSVVIVKQ
jgi:O-methyltransferase